MVSANERDVSKFTSLGGRENWCCRRWNLSASYTKFRKALLLFCRSDYASGVGSTTSFYSGLVEAECDENT